MRVTLPGEASPSPVKVPPSVSTVACTMAVIPFSSLGHLHQGGGDAPQAPLVGQVQQPGVEHEAAPVPLDDEFLLHRSISPVRAAAAALSAPIRLSSPRNL